jgi:hypothetical protein
LQPLSVRAVLAVAVVLACARPAAACEPVFDPGVVGRPVFTPADAVTISSEEVEVDCDSRSCAVSIRYAITVGRPAHATPAGNQTGDSSLAVGTAVPAPEVELAPGDSQLTLTARAELWTYIDDCFRDGVIARHPILGSAPRGTGKILAVETAAAPRTRFPSSWHLVVDRRPAESATPAATRLWFELPPRRFVHGGPVAMIGVSSGPGRTVRLRGGWEAAIAQPWLVFALTGDSDGASTWAVALTAEAVSRAWILPLSFGAGAGPVVADGGRVGGRALVSAALGPGRIVISTDVVGSTSRGVDLAVAALFGGSL